MDHQTGLLNGRSILTVWDSQCWNTGHIGNFGINHIHIRCFYVKCTTLNECDGATEQLICSSAPFQLKNLQIESPSCIGSGVWPQVGVIKKSTSSKIIFIYLIKRVRIFAAFIKSKAGFFIIKWGASFRWLSSLYCPLWISILQMK